MLLYSRADSWLGWGESRESDNVLRSLGRIFQISMRGLRQPLFSLFSATRTSAAGNPLRFPSHGSARDLALAASDVRDALRSPKSRATIAAAGINPANVRRNCR